MKVGAFCFGDITRLPLLQDALSAIARRNRGVRNELGSPAVSEKWIGSALAGKLFASTIRMV